MKHLFVSYEIAKLLNEKGFDEICLGWIAPDEYLSIGIREVKNSDCASVNYAVPIHQQVIDWLATYHFADCYTIPLLTTSPKRYESLLLFRGKTHYLGWHDTQMDAINRSIKEALKLI